MKRVGFAKIGKSVLFNTARHGAIGGDNEAPLLIQALANNNPNVEFDILGRSDFDRLEASEYAKLFPYGNVVSSGAKFKGKDEVKALSQLDNVSVDHCVMMAGTICSVNIPHKIYKINTPGEISKPMYMAMMYSAPILHWLNETKTPYVEVINDPRYFVGKARDIFHHPHTSLGQYDYTYNFKHITSYEDQTYVRKDINVKYAGMETIFCYNAKEPAADVEKTINFSVVLNEGVPSRYDMLNEWILNRFSDVQIYGKWDEPRALADKRFVGPHPMAEIQRVMSKTKYTFIIPIRKGWVTSKYIEMIHAGCIPFFHPSYDEQNHLDYPKELKPKTPEEMMKVIDYLNKNDDIRVKVLADLRKRYCRPELYDGTYLSKTIMTALDSTYELPDLNKYTAVKPIKSTNFSDFI